MATTFVINLYVLRVLLSLYAVLFSFFNFFYKLFNKVL